MQNIIDPKTYLKYSIFSNEGLKLLKKHVKTFLGGSSPDAVADAESPDAVADAESAYATARIEAIKKFWDTSKYSNYKRNYVGYKLLQGKELENDLKKYFEASNDNITIEEEKGIVDELELQIPYVPYPSSYENILNRPYSLIHKVEENKKSINKFKPEPIYYKHSKLLYKFINNFEPQPKQLIVFSIGQSMKNFLHRNSEENGNFPIQLITLTPNQTNKMKDYEPENKGWGEDKYEIKFNTLMPSRNNDESTPDYQYVTEGDKTFIDFFHKSLKRLVKRVIEVGGAVIFANFALFTCNEYSRPIDCGRNYYFAKELLEYKTFPNCYLLENYVDNITNSINLVLIDAHYFIGQKKPLNPACSPYKNRNVETIIFNEDADKLKVIFLYGEIDLETNLVYE